MKDGFAIFDAHTHVGVARHSGRTYTPDQLLRDMDRNGIDLSLVIPFPVVGEHRAAHDEIGRAVKAHPDRLRGAASMYPYLPADEFRTEVRRCREQHGFCALKLQPQYQPLNPLSESSGFLFESAIENQMAVICHTGAGIPYALPSLMMVPARKYPELPIVLAHSGGGGVFSGEAIVAAMFCPNIFLELSCLMPCHVLEILRHVPSDRLMIGSDLPENLKVEIGKILGLDVADEKKRNILSGTAARLWAGSSR